MGKDHQHAPDAGTRVVCCSPSACTCSRLESSVQPVTSQMLHCRSADLTPEALWDAQWFGSQPEAAVNAQPALPRSAGRCAESVFWVQTFMHHLLSVSSLLCSMDNHLGVHLKNSHETAWIAQSHLVATALPVLSATSAAHYAFCRRHSTLWHVQGTGKDCLLPTSCLTPLPMPSCGDLCEQCKLWSIRASYC